MRRGEGRGGEGRGGNISLTDLCTGCGSLSSLASVGHGSVSFISEEKTNLEIKKLRKELQEEHNKCKRLQSQLSTNVSVISLCHGKCDLAVFRPMWCPPSSSHSPT